jgi:hypothetical protein
MATMDQVIEAYLLLRQEKETILKKHKEELAPYTDKMNKLLAWTHQQLQSQGQKNARVDSGTAFLQTDVSVTVEDWDSVWDFVVTNGLKAMLERRVSKGVVQEYIESTGEVPPGVKVTSEISCHIRKS